MERSVGLLRRAGYHPIMDLLAPIRSFDRFQQRHTPLAVPIAVVKKFGDDQAGNLAALVAYYAFFSLFPLLLVFVTVLGFVLNGDPSALHSVKSSVLGRFPVIGTPTPGQQLTGRHARARRRRSSASLWAGLGVTQAATQALDRVWAVPIKQRPSFFAARLRGIVLLIVARGAVPRRLGRLRARQRRPRRHRPAGGRDRRLAAAQLRAVHGLVQAALHGRAVVALDSCPGRFWPRSSGTVLQALGGVYIDHVKQSNNAYGTFALVLGVLAWLHLGAQLTLYCAEVNVVLERRLWPRSLFGPPVGARRSADADGAREGRGALRRAARSTSTSRQGRPAMQRTRPTVQPAERPQNRRSAAARPVSSSGHEHRPPSAGQPPQSERWGSCETRELGAQDAGGAPLQLGLELRQLGASERS